MSIPEGAAAEETPVDAAGGGGGDAWWTPGGGSGESWWTTGETSEEAAHIAWLRGTFEWGTPAAQASAPPDVSQTVWTRRPRAPDLRLACDDNPQ